MLFVFCGITFLNFLPDMQFIPVIETGNEPYLQHTFISGCSFVPDVLFQFPKGARFCFYTLWLSSVSREVIRVQRGQETWMC
jgi:hypothetical protein